MAPLDKAPMRGRITILRRGTAWPPIGMQIERLVADLNAHRRLAAAGDPLIRGAVLAAAHAALRLAVTPVTVEADRHIRYEALNVAISVLGAAGLPHVENLVRAALLYDVDAAIMACGLGHPQ